ncbi:transcription initiation protein spt5 protein [Diplodia corticola]|uniref:Transcription initiation protein spt5 protein n=1 Tax=Diplodia corticola TaxID=236234 RepID=A0A1J9R0M1_9PEZI|nr:transcription initiation protein spt5 protein [Diplodia corticola]OJD34176.1 transcription initiation protein spt5 protein [Diplodia corticola]
MIGTSTAEYIFIRACILGLRSVTPLALLYCLARVVRPHAFHLPLIFDIWAAAEAAFYFFFYLPRKRQLQKAAVHPPAPTRDQRARLFSRCSDHVPDFERYLRGWFMGAPLSEIKRENLREFLAWAFLDTADVHSLDGDEFDGYMRDVEARLGKPIESGRGKANALRLSLDQVRMTHRSLLWYLCVFVVDAIASTRLWYYQFDYHRTRRRHWYSVLPPRPHNLFAKHISPSRSITYWHRPHAAKDMLPILFIHGIGIGLYPYVNMLSEINVPSSTRRTRHDIGIIAIEIMPISFRITTSPALRKREMCAEIARILAFHGWERVVLVSHSYGSVVTTHMLHSPLLSPAIASLLLIDPVTFLLHLPDVACNFIIRKPRRANEHQLSYFASQDMGVAHTLSRCFFWSENIMWKEDLAGRDVTVSLSGRDLIVDTETVRGYLKGEGKWEGKASEGNGVDGKRSELDVLWFEDLDHAQVFDTAGNRRRLINVLERYCARV